MIMEIAFVLSMSMLLAGAVKLGGAMLGNGVDMPSILPFWFVGPTHRMVMYPSILFQVWFWTDKLGVLS